MRIEDEYGTSWKVEAGDPARPLVNLLNRLPLDWIVLPRYTLISGGAPGQPPVLAPPAHGASPRLIRMYDCLEVVF